MAKSLFWLSEEAWEALSPHLPRGRPGKSRVDDRTVISGILHVLKTGCRWRDVPPAYGPPTTIYNRYNRWSQRRVWQRIFEKMAAAGPIAPAKGRSGGVVIGGCRPPRPRAEEASTPGAKQP
jgi:transposase